MTTLAFSGHRFALGALLGSRWAIPCMGGRSGLNHFMTKTLTLRIYRNKRREFAWALIGANGEKLCSGEGYKRRIDMERTIVLVFLGKYLACGSRSIETVLHFRDDIRLEDLTQPNAKMRCNRKCKP